MNELIFHAHMAFLNQINSRQNEPNDYYRISFTFFCSDFAAYVRRNTVIYAGVFNYLLQRTIIAIKQLQLLISRLCFPTIIDCS